MTPLRLFTSLLVLALASRSAFAEDRVVITSGPSTNLERTLRGTVEDYNGRQLIITLTTGQRQTIPSQRVKSVASQWNADHRQADALAAEHKYEEAIEVYYRAGKSEQRSWVRRRILAEIVTCYENLGSYDRAGETFLLLMKADEHWQYFERIPLAWTTSLTDAATDRRAAAWLGTDSLPPAVLLGASWSMSGAERAAAITTLRKLSNHADPRIAHLADAQLWRANLATVGEQELAAWEEQIERMPAALRAGPYLMLAKGLAGQETRALEVPDRLRQQAAWTYLRVPILFPERHALAAACLSGAAAELDKLGSAEALNLYRELAEDFSSFDAGQAAKARLQRP